MVELKLGNVESQFANIIWNHEPIPSGELVKICEKELEWKKSTTYTMLKRLCERGIFKNENGIVSSLMTKAEFGAAQSEKFVEDTFEGSLPAFLAAFTTRKKLSKAEIDEIRQMIDSLGVSVAGGPSHILRNGSTFLFSEGTHQGDEKFSRAICRVDIFLLEIYRHSGRGQVANGSKGIHGVLGESGQRFGHDQVDLSVQRIGYHAIKTVPSTDG